MPSGATAAATGLGLAAATATALALVAACAPSLSGDPVPSPAAGGTAVQAGESGRVTTIVDGDTIDVSGVGRVRLIGIDTPERGACGYESATLALAALILDEHVTLVSGASEDVDRYGRRLRYVDAGPVDAGLSMIRDGWAIARYDSRDGYGRHSREDQYVAADRASPDRGCYPDDEP